MLCGGVMQTDWLTDRGGSETIAPQAENTEVETPRELWGREHTHTKPVIRVWAGLVAWEVVCV